MTELHTLSVAAAAAAIARNEITSKALVAACLEQVRKRDADVQAWAYLDPDQALAQARAADAAQRAGKVLGPLHGVPFGIKDIIDTADMPTECGSAYFQGRRPSSDAACVAALRSAGAVIMGKTVTTELATLTPPKTRNPHNLQHTPGGSSSGSAAGLASGMFPGALATQTGGSVIRPASYCGIYALKPTFGMISRTGVLLQSHSLDTIGVYGRGIEDLALAADCLTAYDSREPAMKPGEPLHLLATTRQPVSTDPTLAFVASPAWDLTDGATREVFSAFISQLGARCEAVDVPILRSAMTWQGTVQSAENAAYYGPLLEVRPDAFTAGLRERLEAGARVRAIDYIRAVNHRDTAATAVENVLARYAAIVMPASPGPAPADLNTTGNPAFNAMWTYLGLPAVTLPLLKVNGMPLGVQLIAARGSDGHLLRTAQWLAQRLGLA
ncbi:amidase [Leptospira interrogans]